MAIDLMDLASRYASNRLDQITQPFTDPGAFIDSKLENKFGNLTPQSTTITYGDNGQPDTVTTKHQVGASDQTATGGMSSLNFAPPSMGGGLGLQMPQQPVGQQPMFNVGQTPQVTAQPAAPQAVANPQQVQAEAQLPQQLAQAAQPTPQVAEQPTTTPQVAQVPNIGQLPQPGPGVQVATAGQLPAGAVANVPSTTPQPNQVTPSAEAAVQQISPEQQAVIDAHNENDPAQRRVRMAQLIATGSEAQKKMAFDMLARDGQKEKAYRDALKKVDELNPTEYGRYLANRKAEGSWVRAIMLQKLGFAKEASDELDKLGYGPEQASAEIANGKQYNVIRSADGTVKRAFDIEGNEVSGKELGTIAAQMMPKQAHLLPAVHGTPVTKTDANGNVVGGLRMYDPRTQTSYVQVGNERQPDVGWTLPTQNYQNVYTAAGAAAQGKAAGEGFTAQPLQQPPGMAGGAGAQPTAAQIAQNIGIPVTPATGTRTNEEQWRQYDAWVAGGRKGPVVARPGTSRHETGDAVDVPQAYRTPENYAKLRAAGLNNTIPSEPWHFERPTTGAAAAPGASVAEQRKALEVATAKEKEAIQIAGKRSESFNKHIDDNVTPDAINGDSIATTRKQQFALFDRPGVDAGKIFGIANGAGAAPGDQRWTMFRDVLLGKVSEPADRIRERAAALGLNREEQSAVAEYAIANADINSKTLKSTAGPGSISDAEQKINQERNVDPTKVPMLGGYNAMAQSQFAGDLARYKGDWATTSKATNTAELERDWRKEKDRLVKMYTEVARDRIKYIADMGNTPAAIKEGYKRYPVPQYDPNANGGEGAWIKKKPLTSYDR